MNRKFKQFLCIFLSTIIVIQMLPLTAFAEDATNMETTDSSNDQNLEVVGELVDERTEYQKTYELSDGTFYEITSATPIHENINGEWVEPDISEDDPETTQEAEDFVKDLSENIEKETSNDEYAIAPASIDINESETSGTSSVVFKYIGENAASTYNKLNKDTNLIAQFPVSRTKDLDNSQITLHCNIMVNAKSARSNAYVYAYGIKTNINIADNNLTVDTDGSGVDTDLVSDEILDFAQVRNLSDYSFDITASYMKWEKGITDNYGIAFTTSSTSTNSITVNGCYIVRQYKILDTYDTDFPYHSIDMGRAGKVYINDYSNSVLIVRNELGIESNILPVELVRYFDFSHAYSNPNPCGYASWWNYSSYVTEITEYNISWHTPDGTTILFVPDSSKNEPGNYVYWKDVDGNGYELVLDQTQNRKLANSRITTPESLTYTFGEYGKVISISDQYNNNINISYKSGDLTQTNIFYIEDSTGRRYYFNYGTMKSDSGASYDILKSISVKIKNQDSGEYEVIEIGNEDVEINYDYTVLPNNLVALSKVTYPDGEFVSYSYENGQLSKIEDVDGRKLELDYSYNGRNIYPCLTKYEEKVKNIDGYSNEEYLDKSLLTIENYNCYERVFTNELGSIETIRYNNNLKITYYNSSENTFYADYSENPNGTVYLSQIISPQEGSTIIDNGDFEKGDTSWTAEPDNLIDGSITGFGQKFLRIFGENDTRRVVSQGVEGDFKKGEVYVIGGYGKANTPIPTSKYFWGIEIHTYSENDEGETIDNTIYNLAFDSTIDLKTQSQVGAFVIPEDTDYLEVQLVYSHQSGYADFDEIQLYKSSDDEVAFFSDTDEQTEASVLSEDTDTQTITNDKGLTTAEITSEGNKAMISKYSYDDSYYLSSSTDTNNVTTNYNYDSANGTLSTITIGNKITSFSYTPTGALKEVSRTVSGLTDSIQNISASYTYSHDRITSVTHNGIKYNFTYNSFGNVKKVDMEILSEDDSSNNLISYDYSNDYTQQLNSITYANGNILSYSYVDGNITSIYFQSSSNETPKLMYKYEYNAGELSKITDYDSNRVTEYSDNGYTVKEIEYTEDGEEQYNTIYSTLTDTSGARHENLYGNEFVSTESESVFNDENNETTYSSSLDFSFMDTQVNIDNLSVSDYFGRIKSSELSLFIPEEDTNVWRSIENNYTYKDYTTSYDNGDETFNVSATTNLIDTFSSQISTKHSDGNEEVINEFSSSYEYDSAGRITHIYYTQNDGEAVLVAYYEYDQSGQIITDADFLGSCVTKYSYDSGGNITVKKIYKDEDILGYNTNTDSLILADTPTSTIDYGYGYADSDSNQNILNGYTDLLTSYDGNNITYDESGNPTTYYGTTFTGEDNSFNFEWQGSLLKSATSLDGESRYEYFYNQEGLRSKKVLYSKSNDNSWEAITEINYLWEDSLLSAYHILFPNNNGEQNEIIIKMLYDEYQSPLGIFISSDPSSLDENTNGNQNNIGPDLEGDFWWFIKDGQGNVLAMYSESDSKTIGCTYDSYGNLTLNMDGTFMDEIKEAIDDALTDNPQLAPLIILILTVAAAASLATVIAVDQTAYRGYMCDFETGLYYCQNRYYSPVWGRFISMDDPAQLTQNVEEPLNANLYAYCYNDPVNNIDPNGTSSYSLTGVGLQAEMSASLLSFSGEVGIELIYVWSKNALYAYYYYGGGAGNGYTNKSINYLKSSLKHISMSPKVSLKNIANLFKLNYSISIGFFGAFTNKSFSWPNSYASYTKSNSISIGKWKGYKSTSTGCKTYGICYAPIGNSGFAFSTTTVSYKKITFNSTAIKTYLSSQKNNIKNAIS